MTADTNSSKHTPGPWQIRDSYTLAGMRAIIANIDGEYIDGRAECTFDVIAVCEDEFGDPMPNANANASLIAAAPDMYEALKRAERWFRDYERQHRAKGTSEGNLKADTNEERADFLRAALARAEGL